MFFLQFVLIYILYFLPGYIILSFFNVGKEERIFVSFAVSSLLFYLSSFLYYLWGNYTILFLPFTPFVLLFISVKKCVSLPEQKLPLLLCSLLPLYSFLQQFLIRFYGLGGWYGDWLMHFQIAQFYAKRIASLSNVVGNYTLTARPPLFNLNGAYFLKLLGDNFFTFQIFSAVANSLFVFPFFYLLHYSFKKQRLVLPVLLLLFFHPAIYRHLTYTWNKLFTTYFIFTGLLLGLKFLKTEQRNLLILSGLAWGLSLFAHQFSFFYFFPFLIFLFVKKNKNNFMAKSLFILTVLLVLSPWYSWAIAKFGWKSTFIENPAVTMAYKTLPKWLGVRAWTFFSTNLPLLFIYSLRRWLRGFSPLVGVYNGYISFYIDCIPGFVGMSLILAVILLMIKGKLKGINVPHKKFLYSLILAGIGGSILTQPYDYLQGSLHTGMLPAMLIFLSFCLTIVLNSDLKKNLWISLLVGEFFIALWSVPLLLPFVRDANLDLKVKYHLSFLYDLRYSYRYYIMGLILSLQGIIISLVYRRIKRDT